jgi:rare lipoprotein A
MKTVFILWWLSFIPALLVFKQTGTASYYAPKFHLRKTSSGEKYHKDSLTAAHKSLPFGTKLKVVNLSNQKSVIVRVNDRLPKKSKRVIDLSYAAAKQLDFIRKGLTKVEISDEL